MIQKNTFRFLCLTILLYFCGLLLQHRICRTMPYYQTIIGIGVPVLQLCKVKKIYLYLKLFTLNTHIIMNKEILLALISKDVSELNRIFSNCELSATLPAEIISLAASKASDLCNNIGQLAECAAEPETHSPAAENVMVADIQALVEAKIDEVKSSLVGYFNANMLSKTDFSERETALKNDIAEANNALYGYVKNLNAETAASVASVAERIDMLDGKLETLASKVESIEHNTPSESPTEQYIAEPIIPTIAELAAESIADPILETETEPTQQPSPASQPTPIVDQPETPEQPEQQQAPAETAAVNTKPTVAESIQTRESILDKLYSREDNSLASSLNKTKINDLKSAISIADRFRFQRELFSGDGEKMNRTISTLNALDTLDDALDYLRKIINIADDNDAMADFLHLLQRRFM